MGLASWCKRLRAAFAAYACEYNMFFVEREACLFYGLVQGLPFAVEALLVHCAALGAHEDKAAVVAVGIAVAMAVAFVLHMAA